MSTAIPDALAVAPSSPDGAELPAWLDTERELLDAVMAHPAGEIAAALQATGTTDLPTLLAVLDPAARRAAEEAAIAAELREITRTRKTSLLTGLADRIEALQ
ncbi:hypothetical protein GCM10027059_26880 [Myceligenerans halotolerans]